MGRSGSVCLLIALTGLTGCGKDRVPAAPGGIVAPPDTVQVIRPVLEPSDSLLPAADPKLAGFDGWPLVFDARFHQSPDYRCRIVLTRAGTTLRELEGTRTTTSCEADWDGRDAAGAIVGVGPIAVAAVLTHGLEELARSSVMIEVVRLGVREVQLAGAGRVPLLYEAMGGVRYGYYEVEAARAPWRLAADRAEPTGAVSLELADGTPRELPMPWAELATPPVDAASPDGAERDTFNLPTAWVAGSLIDVTATLSADVAGAPAGGAPTAVEIRIVPPAGMDAATAALTFADGAPVTVRTTSSPVPAVGRYDLGLDWRFEARRAPGEWQPVPGSVRTVHRLYGIVAAPVFDYGDVPHRAWVDVVDRVAGWVGGETADPIAVGSRIVEGVYYELGLAYDRAFGASYYTDYPFGGFSGAVHNLSRFRTQEDGTIINCSDAASLVSTHANMVGLQFDYHIIQDQFGGGFYLNYLRGIGSPDFTFSPFFSGRNAFSYHAVTGPVSMRIYDATLAVDGDSMPNAPPHELLLVQDLDPTLYLQKLSPEWAELRISLAEQVRLR